MENRWSDEAAKSLDEVGVLVYRSNLLGADQTVVNRGGGNTSVKRRVVDFRGREVDTLTVKGTGADLRTITAKGFADVVIDDMMPLRSRDRMSDEEMTEYLSHCLIDPAATRPSIETLLHGFLRAKHIDHVHADVAGAIATAADGQEITRRLFGEEVSWIPYIRPGFVMARMTVDAVEANPAARFVLLQKHGLITWADDAKECYLRNVEFIQRGREYLAEQATGKRVFGGMKVQPLEPAARAGLAGEVMPALRGSLSRNKRVVLHFDDAPDIMEFVSSQEGKALAEAGLACPDHVLYTKVKPFVVDVTAEAGAAAVTAAIDNGLARYVEGYARFFEANKETWDTAAEPLPKITLVPGLGMITAGKDKRAATITAEFYHRAIAIMRGATSIDRFVSLTEKEAYDIEYWPLELYKLTLLPPEKELSRRVAFITGAAGALGRGIAERLVQEGAQVALADINAEGARALADDLTQRYGVGVAAAIQMDVTSETSVQEALAEAVRSFGGVDILVCNAGVAYSHSLEETSLEEWNKTMDVLSTGYFLTARAGVKLMRQQRTPDGACLGGSIIFVASKAGLAAAKNAAAYATAKAAVLHLARCVAEEVAEEGIRVNSLAPDAIISGSGLWAGQWGQARAQAHGVPADQLADFYRGRNMLKTAVTAEDVAEAALFFASDRSKATTGGVLSVDGGLHDGYVR